MFTAKKIHTYREEQFGITRTSPHSATVNVICGVHEHDDFLVRLIEKSKYDWIHGSGGGDADWAAGREDQGYPIEGNFLGAVEHAAALLLEECKAMQGVAEFFGDQAGMETTDKVLAYMGRQFLVRNDSSIAAKVSIHCKEHEHRYCMIGLVEYEAAGWVMGRPDAQSPKYIHKGTFAEAVEQAANLLLRECLSMNQVEEFFGEG